jgi:hypothetical protein
MSNATTVPAYLNLVASILELCTELGVEPIRAATTSTLPENKGYVFVRFGSADAAAIIIPKSTGAVKLIDVHVDLSDMACWVPLAKPNGRVLGRIDAALATWADILPRLFGASKRPVQRASQAASSTTADMSAFLAKLQTMGKPKAQPVELQVVDSEEEYMEDELTA